MKSKSTTVARRIAKDKARFLEALTKTFGNISEASKMIGIDRETAYNWKRSDPVFCEAFDSERNRVIDVVESALMKNILSGNVVAQIFFLKCQAKDRGYIERSEFTGKDGAPLNPLFKIIQGIDISKV